MATAVSVSAALTCTVQENLSNVTTPSLATGGLTVTHSAYNVAWNGGSATTPPATQCCGFLQALGAGTATIDLRALVGTGGGALDANGLKLQWAQFENPSTNANSITIVGGASNGYLLLGAAGSLVLEPGQAAAIYGFDKLPDVDGTHKTIDLSGTGSQTLKCFLVFG